MKIKLKNTKFQTILDYIAIVLLAAMYIYLFIRWNSIPDKVPGHYNALGEIDRWGNKGELLFLPVVNTLMYLMFTVIQHFPAIWNIPVAITDQNRDKVYGCTKNMLMVMKVEILTLFFYLIYNQIEVKALSPYFLPLFIMVLFGTIAYFIIAMIKVSKSK